MKGGQERTLCVVSCSWWGSGVKRKAYHIGGLTVLFVLRKKFDRGFKIRVLPRYFKMVIGSIFVSVHVMGCSASLSRTYGNSAER